LKRQETPPENPVARRHFAYFEKSLTAGVHVSTLILSRFVDIAVVSCREAGNKYNQRCFEFLDKAAITSNHYFLGMEISMAKQAKFVYFFGGGKSEGKSSMKELLGGKGANLAEMCSLGLPVPPGFTITTEVCDLYYKLGKKYPAGLDKQIGDNIKKVERATGKTFGKGKNPLLVSVRSGAAVSMPGMVDTVLNLGLNDETLEAMIKLTGNERFVLDAYRRFMQMFGDVVLGMEHHDFEKALDGVKKKFRAANDTDLDIAGLRAVVAAYKGVYKKARKTFPQDARKQLQAACDAVFGSWNNPRANRYREINDIRGLIGTAVNVQAMVFGNMGETSGTGVAFTRNPSTGENKFYGEYLMNARG